MTEKNALKILQERAKNNPELQEEYEKEKNRFYEEIAKRAWRDIIYAIEEVECKHGIECDTPDFIEVMGKKFYASILDY